MSTIGNNLLAQYYAQQEALPNEYRRVEYLESTGTQYIDTSVDITTITRQRADFQFTLTEGSQISGVLYRNQRLQFGIYHKIIPAQDVFTFGLGTVAIYTTNEADLNRHTVIFDVLNKKVTFDEQTFSYESATVSLQQNVTLPIGIQRYNNSYLNPCKWKIFQYTIHSQSTLSRNFIPCVRLSDNKPGLYDLCGSVCPLTNTPFYVNAGTGEFVIPT